MGCVVFAYICLCLAMIVLGGKAGQGCGIFLLLGGCYGGAVAAAVIAFSEEKTSDGKAILALVLFILLILIPGGSYLGLKQEAAARTKPSEEQ